MPGSPLPCLTTALLSIFPTNPDPCGGPNAHGRPFELGVAASEVPHRSYTERISDDSFYTPPRNPLDSHPASVAEGAGPGSGGSGSAAEHMSVASSAKGVMPEPAGVVPPAAAGNESCLAAPFSAPPCASEVGKLRVLILHHHVPLYDRYGCDKRLYHIIESLKALGHEVVYGGKHGTFNVQKSKNTTAFFHKNF